MKVKDRLDILKKGRIYTFLNLNFKLYDEDYIFIYDRPEGTLQYSCKFKDIDLVPNELQELEYKKDSIIRLKEDDIISKEKLGRDEYQTKPFAVILYLDGPDRIETGIKNKAYYI